MSVPSWFKKVMETEDGVSFLSFISKAPGNVVFACDEQSFLYIKNEMKKCGFPEGRIVEFDYFHIFWSMNLHVDQVIVIDLADEDLAALRLKQRLLDEKFPGFLVDETEVLGLFADILPLYMTRTSGNSKFGLGRKFGRSQPVSAAKLCAVFGSPRSGTTLLCELMQSVGFGRPVEHLRPHTAVFFNEISKLRGTNSCKYFSFIRFVQRIVAFGEVGGIFSTKLIFKLFDISKAALSREELAFILDVCHSMRILILSRANRLDQAISFARAEVVGRWHSYEAKVEETPDVSNDDLVGVLDRIIEQDKSMVDFLCSVPGELNDKIFVVDYDRLSSDSIGVMEEIARLLGVPLGGVPKARVTKIADEWNEGRATRFRAEMADSKQLLVPSVAELIAAKLEARATLRAADIAKVEAIRGGHARTRHGAYQDRHFHLIEYDAFSLPGLVGMWRGPKPDTLDAGKYILCLGAAQTYGAFVANPYPKAVGAALGIPTLNLSNGGAGPRYFSEFPEMLKLVSGAKMTVIQVMSARMMPTRLFEAVGEVNRMRWLGDSTGEILDAETVWERARRELSAEALVDLIKEARQTWVKSMINLAHACTGPKILLWFSVREPAYKMSIARVSGSESIFGQFPQMIDEQCIEEVRPFFDEFVSVTSNHGLPAKTVSEFSDTILPVIFGGGEKKSHTLQIINHYYPSQEMHDEVSEKIIPVVERLLNVSA